MHKRMPFLKVVIYHFQLCKNIVLAGIGSLTLMEETSTRSAADSDNFLISAEQDDSRDSVTVCMESLKDFNPMVNVSVEKGVLFCDMRFHDDAIFS
jgi:ubiquitin-like 1-activating enzyme E1 A